ncbi:hypothetical protein [Allosphingosinicella humi]|jgi:hypothetical protein
MKRTRSLLIGGALISLSISTLAVAKPNPAAKPHQGTATTTELRGPSKTGQPGVECGEPGATRTPGKASSARGSAFNEEGVAGTKYAGQQPQNSRNTASVSQYDVACRNH